MHAEVFRDSQLRGHPLVLRNSTDDGEGILVEYHKRFRGSACSVCFRGKEFFSPFNQA